MLLKRSIKNLNCSCAFFCETAFEGEKEELMEVAPNDQPYLIS